MFGISQERIMAIKASWVSAEPSQTIDKDICGVHKPGSLHSLRWSAHTAAMWKGAGAYSIGIKLEIS